MGNQGQDENSCILVICQQNGNRRQRVAMPHGLIQFHCLF
jgi:hypothetical protein